MRRSSVTARMRPVSQADEARYVVAPGDVEFVDRLIGTSVNLVGRIYGKIYFPTYSNSLKEIGRYLGFEWTWPQASGAAALLLRRAWELGVEKGLKRELIGYNMDDCRAAARVADALVRSAAAVVRPRCGRCQFAGGWFPGTFGKFDAALPEFAKSTTQLTGTIKGRKCTRVPTRSSGGPFGNPKAGVKAQLSKRSDGRGRPGKVPTGVGRQDFGRTAARSHIVYDLKFTRRGIKRWAVRYRYSMYRCSECRAEMTIYSRDSQFGPNLRAFFIYLLIELRLSYQKAMEHVSLLFDVVLPNIDRLRDQVSYG